MRSCSFLLIALLAAACGSKAPGAKPHDMSVAAHDREAAAHQAIASEHEARYDPGVPDPCDARVASCWTAMRTSTEQHRDEAAQHARIAAAHRRASAALRQAEARACGLVSQTDRDTSPFQRTEDIVRAEPLVEADLGGDMGRTGEAVGTRIVGAVVTFRAVPGLTVPRFQQMIDCHLARNAALGHVVPEMPDCPLVPRGANARVRASGTGFAVEIRGADSASAREILARARRLARQEQAVMQ